MNLHLNCCTADQLSAAERQRILQLADAHRQADPAADRVTSAGMWLVAHMTYSQRVRTDGAALEFDDFKTTPEGHTGGSLNMVPAYAGYLLTDALDGVTRAWMMGQGLSLRWDLLPAPYREALSRLHSDVPAFSADQAKRIVEQAFGAPVDEIFASFDDKPLAAGSVAQIHPACMHDGRDVVVKITRPGIHAQVKADLRLLRRTMRVAQWIWPPLKRHRPLELVNELGVFHADPHPRESVLLRRRSPVPAFRRSASVRSLAFLGGRGFRRCGIALAAAGHGHRQIGAPVNSRRLLALNVGSTT